MHEPARLSTSDADTSPLRIEDVRAQGVLRLQTWIAPGQQQERRMALGDTELPGVPGQVESGPARMLCLGPTEWMILMPAGEVTAFLEQFGISLRSQGIVATDLSRAQAQLRIDGRAARELLSKGCGVDLHPRHCLPGSCVRTRLAQIQVVIECLEAPDQLQLHVSRSYLAYLHSWLADAAVDLG